MLKSSKKLLVIAVATLLPYSTHAQIPVTDILSNVTSMLNQIQTIAQWGTQLNNMITQIEQLDRQFTQMEKEYEKITGTRNLGAILNDPAFRNYLSDDWRNVYDELRKGGYASLTGDAKTIFDDNRIFDMCAGIEYEIHRKACESQAIKGAQDQAFATSAYDAAKNRVEQIQGLMNQINSTEDPKAIQELQARISVEQAAIQNEQTKLAMFQMISISEKELQNQRLREIQARTWASTGRVEVDAITFE